MSSKPCSQLVGQETAPQTSVPLAPAVLVPPLERFVPPAAIVPPADVVPPLAGPVPPAARPALAALPPLAGVGMTVDGVSFGAVVPPVLGPPPVPAGRSPVPETPPTALPVELVASTRRSGLQSLSSTSSAPARAQRSSPTRRSTGG
jgi:hypothetical protein